MYAVVFSGGKQHRVSAGESLEVERLEGSPGDPVEFEDIRLLAGEGVFRCGPEELEKARVRGIILAHGRARKILVFKKKRRKNYRRKQGHRQAFTRIRITEILPEGRVAQGGA